MAACYLITACDACIASANGCEWCPGYGCYQTGSGCPGASTTCPATDSTAVSPTWINSNADALGFLAVGGVAIAVLAALTFSRVEERMCGRRAVAPPRPHAYPSVLLRAGCSALWAAACAALAAPKLSFLYYDRGGASQGIAFVFTDLFSYHVCGAYVSPSASFCESIPLRQYVKSFVGVTASVATPFINSAYAIAIMSACVACRRQCIPIA